MGEFRVAKIASDSTIKECQSAVTILKKNAWLADREITIQDDRYKQAGKVIKLNKTLKWIFIFTTFGAAGAYIAKP